MWPLECKQEFSKICPGDLVFLPDMTQIQTWPKYCQNKHCFIKIISQMWSLALGSGNMARKM